MTDNFHQIATLLKFEDEHEFYFLQIIQRGKDTNTTGNRLIRYYCIFSMAQFVGYADEIKKLCEAFCARAYIHLNRRDARHIGIDMLTDIAERIRTSNFSHLHRIHSTACGRYGHKKDKSWVIDIDGEASVDKIVAGIAQLQPVGDKFVAKIPTKSGCHLITHPFNTAEFAKLYPQVDVHKNNPTVLFIP